jgi:dCTP diphosphatase
MDVASRRTVRRAIGGPRTMKDFAAVQESIRAFVREREWDRFHSPKNLAMALSVECAELVEHFQWTTEDDSRHPPPDRREAIGDEIADVFVYLSRIAQVLELDLLELVERKMLKNAAKYPVERVKGSSKKYSEY